MTLCFEALLLRIVLGLALDFFGFFSLALLLQMLGLPFLQLLVPQNGCDDLKQLIAYILTSFSIPLIARDRTLVTSNRSPT